jgi:hypothetical protein
MRKGNGMRTLVAISVLAFSGTNLFAAVDGVVLNKTSGKPQAGVSVSLVKPGQGGMRTLGSTTTDASGHFAFDKDEPGGGPQLLQASYSGVNYNKLLTPNMQTSGIELDIFESTRSAEVARVTQRMLVLEPAANHVVANETVILDNQSTTTFNDPAQGGLQFYLPPAADGQVRVQAQGPGGMPLPRAAERTPKGNIYKVDFPIKPGQTEFQVQYTLPTGSPMTFRGQVVNIKGMVAGPLRLVAPAGVTISGSDVQPLGTEPTTQATIYNVLRDGPFSVEIAGTGSLRGPEAEEGDSNDSPPATEGMPTLYQHLGWLVGLTFAILAAGLALVYRSSPVRTPYGR